MYVSVRAFPPRHTISRFRLGVYILTGLLSRQKHASFICLTGPWVVVIKLEILCIKRVSVDLLSSRFSSQRWSVLCSSVFQLRLRFLRFFRNDVYRTQQKQHNKYKKLCLKNRTRKQDTAKRATNAAIFTLYCPFANKEVMPIMEDKILLA